MITKNLEAPQKISGNADFGIMVHQVDDVLVEDGLQDLVSATFPFGIIWVLNWVGIGCGGIGD